MTGNSLEDKDACYLAYLLENQSILRYLKLAHNRFSDDAAEKLATALGTVFFQIDVKHNFF